MDCAGWWIRAAAACGLKSFGDQGSQVQKGDQGLRLAAVRGSLTPHFRFAARLQSAYIICKGWSRPALA